LVECAVWDREVARSSRATPTNKINMKKIAKKITGSKINLVVLFFIFLLAVAAFQSTRKVEQPQRTSTEGSFNQFTQPTATPPVSRDTTTDNSVEQQNTLEETLIVYYEQGCPFCEEVKEYLLDTGAREKLPVLEKDISANSENMTDFVYAIVMCRIDIEEASVPLLYANGFCYRDAREIINYFSQRLETL
jgi:glutaredoxin